MSATFKNAKKKLIQTEFRRALNEHKNKHKDVKKIDSPLAKYNDQGQLTCILCKSVVRSETVWPVHINSKQHKENIELAKRLKQRTNNFTTPLKRSITPPIIVELPEKKPKGILKNSNSKTNPEVDEKKNGVPEDFFDNSSKQPPILPISRASTEAMEIDQDDPNDETLPEGFFDDPKQDAKARHQEYKDPVEEEWEKFQKEIREAGSKSAAIIAEDQEEATTERQIDEIDEQLKKLSKVLDLEKKKEHIISVCNETKIVENENSDDDDDFNEFDEFLDWRSKKSFK